MFNLIDKPRPAHPARGTPRLFKNDLIEAFSHIKPSHVLATWVPIVSFLYYLSYTRGVTPLQMVGLTAAGWFVWTLVEYLLHRYIFHFEPHGETQEQVAYLIHGIHHDYPWDADRLVMPPLVSIGVGAVLWFPIQFLVGQPYNLAFFCGIAIGYVAYDLIHYATHHNKPKTAVGRYLRAYHMVHHFKTPLRRYGVSIPLWDYVFRTQPIAGDTRADAPVQSHNLNSHNTSPRNANV